MADEPGVTYLEEILQALTSNLVRFVVAGGVAAVLHGIERTTMNLDIALELSPENVGRFREAVEALGLRPLVPVPVEALADAEAVRVMVEEKHAIVFMLADPNMPLRKVDVFLTEELRYESLVEDSIQVELPGMAFPIVSLERLLELKRAIQPARDKDQFDIRAIERLLGQGGMDD